MINHFVVSNTIIAVEGNSPVITVENEAGNVFKVLLDELFSYRGGVVHAWG